MRDTLKFYASWLAIGFRHSFGKSDAIAGFLGVALPAIAHWGGTQEGAMMGDLAWEIPLGVFTALFVVRLLLAPYWMHQEREKELASLRAHRESIVNSKGFILLEGVDLVPEFL